METKLVCAITKLPNLELKRFIFFSSRSGKLSQEVCRNSGSRRRRWGGRQTMLKPFLPRHWVKADLDFRLPSLKSATNLISTLWNRWPARFQQIENFLLKSDRWPIWKLFDIVSAQAPNLLNIILRCRRRTFLCVNTWPVSVVDYQVWNWIGCQFQSWKSEV